ncbi:hypothetical protein MU460_14110, partial [Staphylococcus aureus]|nr:hypothetical protein [Staphylococcus aureus]
IRVLRMSRGLEDVYKRQSPARVLRQVTDQELHWKRLNTKEYQDLAIRCRTGLSETKPLTQVEENRPRLKGTTDVKPKSAQ